MKLSCNNSNVNGYPMSHSVGSLKGHQLSYEARELACHSKSAYVNKLQGEKPYTQYVCTVLTYLYRL